MNEDEKWMQVAIDQANLGFKKSEVPVGAVLIQNGKLIASAYNQPISKNDPTAHAEILVLRKAGKLQKNYRLANCTLYVTLEPCAMCLGAMVHARIDRVVFGALDPKSGVCGSCADLTTGIFFNHDIKFHSGVLEKKCKNILQLFFQQKRLQSTKINKN